MEIKIKKPSAKLLPWLLLAVILIVAAAFSTVVIYHKQKQTALSKQTANKNVYLSFLEEIYGIIQQNYWNKISDSDLTELFRLAADKAGNSSSTLESKDPAGLDKMLADKLNALAADKKKKFASQVGDLVLANLQPLGRSRLYSQNLVQALSNEVNNVDTSTDLYSQLGINKNADQKTIDKAYQAKSQELAKDQSKAAKDKLTLLNRAYEAVKTPERKQTYDTSGAEPAVTYKQPNAETFYIKISRFTPTLIDEFQAAAKTVDSQPSALHTLILDLRGNIGGAIDQLPYFLGPFIGQNQYAFEYFHQGVYTPFKTAIGFLPELVRYKRVIILIDGQTQSSAEVMAGVLKKYNVGVLVGTKTKGWGTIESLFDITNQIDSNQKYAVFLAHTLTLGDDNLPIEGKGIEPMLNIEDKNWQKALAAYDPDPLLIQTIKNIYGK
jgi:hypothetical protein